MLRIVALVALGALAGCQSAPSAAPTRNTETLYSGGDGQTVAKAIVINCDSESSGVAAEYSWIRANHPGAKVVSQSVLHFNGRTYDLLEWQSTEIETQSVYFDITRFFGKL
jgi:hypothetical protein